MAPASRPRTTRPRRRNAITTGMRAANSPAALRMTQSGSRQTVMFRAMTTEMGYARSVLVMMKPTMKSDQVAMNTKAPAAKTAFQDNGITTRRNTANGVAPSMVAASSRSRGKLRKNASRIQIANGRSRPEYTITIEWACDPARTAALARRVFDEIQFVKDTSFTPDQVRRLRAALLHDFEQDSQDNGYLLNEIARRYAEGDAAHVAAVVDLPDRIAALTGDAIQEAARTYLDTANYVKVTLMPETR